MVGRLVVYQAGLGRTSNSGRSEEDFNRPQMSGQIFPPRSLIPQEGGVPANSRATPPMPSRLLLQLRASLATQSFALQHVGRNESATHPSS